MELDKTYDSRNVAIVNRLLGCTVEDREDHIVARVFGDDDGLVEPVLNSLGLFEAFGLRRRRQIGRILQEKVGIAKIRLAGMIGIFPKERVVVHALAILKNVRLDFGAVKDEQVVSRAAGEFREHRFVRIEILIGGYLIQA